MFKIPFKTKKPKSPAINEEIKIINFELFIIVSLSKASKVTKIDIVKPIPAKSPTPKIDFQFKSDGSLQSPKVTAKSAKEKYPKVCQLLDQVLFLSCYFLSMFVKCRH